MKSNVLSVASVDLILSMLIMFCFGFKLFLQKWKQFWYISSLKMKLINTQCTYLLLFQISYQLCSLKNLHLQPTSNLSVVELQVAEEKPTVFLSVLIKFNLFKAPCHFIGVLPCPGHGMGTQRLIFDAYLVAKWLHIWKVFVAKLRYKNVCILVSVAWILIF